MKRRTLKNEAAQQAAAAINQKEIERIIHENERATTQERLSTFILFVRSFLLVLIAWSVVTEAGFLYPQFKDFSNSTLLSVFMTLMLIVIIEGAKLGAGKLWIKFKTQGWLTEGVHYWIFYILLTVVALIGFGGSAIFSIKGAPMIPSYLHKATDSIPQKDIAQIHAYYDRLIADQKQQITTAQTMTWKGKIVSDGRKLMQTAETNIQDLNRLRASDISEARKYNNRMREETGAQLESFGTWMQGFGGIGEFLTLLFLGIVSVYERRCYIELEEDEDDADFVPSSLSGGTTPHMADPTGAFFRTEPGLNSSPSPVQQIGFRTGKSLQDESVNLMSEQAHPVQKPTGGTVRVKRDDRVIEHTGRDEQIKYYTRKQVIGFIKKYEGRVREGKKKVQKGTGGQRTKNALTNNQEWLAYWSKRLSEFDKK